MKNFLFVFLLAAACSPAEEASGGPFVDAVSSASYGLDGGSSPALHFHKSTRQVSTQGNKGSRPPDAITAATYTLVKTLSDTRAVYQNNDGAFLGFTLEGGSVKVTAKAASEADLRFDAPVGTYR